MNDLFPNKKEWGGIGWWNPFNKSWGWNPFGKWPWWRPDRPSDNLNSNNDEREMISRKRDVEKPENISERPIETSRPNNIINKRNTMNWNKNWLFTVINWVAIIFVIWILFLSPIQWLILWSDELPWIIPQFQSMVNNEIDWSLVMSQMILSAIAWLVIWLVVFTPTEKYKSALAFCYMHTLKAWYDLQNDANTFAENPTKFKELILNVFAYWIWAIIVLWLYFILINQTVLIVASNSWFVQLFAHLANILVYSFILSGAINYFEKENPMPKISWWVVSADKTASEKNTVKQLILLFVIIFLSSSIAWIVWAFIEDTVRSNAGLSNFLEGEAHTVDDITNIFDN